VVCLSVFIIISADLLDIYEALPTDPYTYPILHKKLDQMPRTYILSAGKDTLRDDSRIFEAELNEVG
jgi:acetyl esterase/lipase